jgi:molybdopterin synthase catalytic subunit
MFNVYVCITCPHQVREQWDVKKISMVHKLGNCPIGEASIVIAVSSGHRREAVEAAHFAIDELKRTVPIWKKVRCNN